MTRPVEITLIASNAVKEAGLTLLPAFEQATGHTVAASWGGTPDIIRRVSAGERADIVILSCTAIDDLIRAGRLAAGSRVDFARSPIGVATRTGAPQPDIASADALRSSLLAASSIVLSSGPSSVYLADLFGRMGIGAALQPKIRQLAPGLSVGAALAGHQGEIGFTQVSELLAVPGIVFVGPLPAEIQHVTVFSLGRAPAAPDAARMLSEFLASPGSAPVLRHCGLAPA